MHDVISLSSLSSCRVAPNGKRASSIQQHFCFHRAAKCDGSVRNGPKTDPIQLKHSISYNRADVFIWVFNCKKIYTKTTHFRWQYGIYGKYSSQLVKMQILFCISGTTWTALQHNKNMNLDDVTVFYILFERHAILDIQTTFR